MLTYVKPTFIQKNGQKASSLLWHLIVVLNVSMAGRHGVLLSSVSIGKSICNQMNSAHHQRR